MPAGTIALTNNSASVTGTGTNFRTEVKPNDFLVAEVGGQTFMLGVQSVESDTALTLLRAHIGPTASGLAWTPIPYGTMARITAQMASLQTYLLGAYQLDKINWQQVFSENKNITVRLPDGSAFTGPSWLRIVELLKDVDLDGLQIIAEQVSTDAAQVAQDTQIASSAATTATDAAKTATEKATAAGTSATNAAKSETSALGSATTATQEADRARAAADEAAQYAGDMDFTMADVRAYVDAVCPVGMRMDWPLASLPDNPALGIKFLRLTGASFDKAAYTKLAAIYTSGVLPDMRGNTVRGYDDGRGVDPGRALLSEQLDAVQNITAELGAAGGVAWQEPNGAFTLGSGTARIVANNAGDPAIPGTRLYFNAALVARTANETRMRNMAWNMIVRAS